MKRSLIISCSLALLTATATMAQENTTTQDPVVQGGEPVTVTPVESSGDLQKTFEPTNTTTENYQKQFPSNALTPTSLSADDDLGRVGGAFTVFPNPSDGNFKVNVPMIEGGEDWDLKIFTAEGRMIGNHVGHLLYDALEREFHINEKAGTYFIHLQVAGQHFFQKLVIL